MNKTLLVTVIALMLSACNKGEPSQSEQPAQAAPDSAAMTPPDAALQPASPELPPVPAIPADTPPFADKVWKVQASSAVAVDTTYTFLSNGTLVIDSHQGTPGYGRWTYVNDALTMIEEGQAYPTDILRLDDETFEIRSNNPGEPVTITLVPAIGMPLPPAPVE